MDLLKLLLLGICIVLAAGQTPEPSTTPEGHAESPTPEGEAESSSEPESEPEDPEYYGTSFEIQNGNHGVSGMVNIIDDRHIMLTSFSYDGSGPADGGMDSPGFCAKYCTYTVMELNTKDILALIVVDKRQTGLKSPNMETKGFIEAMAYLKQNGLKIVEVITDAHVGITSIIHAYFYISTTPNSTPSGAGMRIPNEEGSLDILMAYDNEMVVLELPDGVMMGDLVWFSVWCDQANADFGHVMFPANISSMVPMPVELGNFMNRAHRVNSSGITILNHKQFLIEDFTYDGQGPDAYFYVGTGPMPTGGNTRVPNEMGSMMKLEEYTGQTLTITLPVGFTVHNIDWFSVWCDQASANFGHVTMPAELLVPVYLGNMMDMMDMYYGTYVGPFDLPTQHDVSGHIFIVDEHRIRLVDFTYDGAGPDAYFYAGLRSNGDDAQPSSRGTRLMDEMGKEDVLMDYQNADIVITLPEGKTVQDIMWFSVWCDQFAVDFGRLMFPSDLGMIPAPVEAGEFTTLAHAVSSGTVTFVDERTVRIENFMYDGAGPDAFFWVGTGNVDASGWPIADESGSYNVLDGYSGETIELTLPMAYTWHDLDYLSVWCRQATMDFGNVQIPEDMYLPPHVEMEMVLSNCVSYDDFFMLNWDIDGDFIYYEFVGALEGDNGYMSFGRSGSDSRSSMINADVFVAYWDNGPVVEDYKLTAYAQCNVAQGIGACPDEFVQGINDVEVLSGSQRDCITRIRFRRRMMTGDNEGDRDHMVGMYVIWSMGRLGADMRVTKHNLRQEIGANDMLMEGNMCQNREVKCRETEDLEAWDASFISDEQDFEVFIGPAGGDRGYPAITGRQSWGIAYYINGMLIPEITMEINKTYTFTVYGGDDENNQGSYHPFYLTEDPEGGYLQKTQAEKNMEKVIAGIDRNGNPTAVGSLCEYRLTTPRDNANDFEEFDDYFQTLRMDCVEPRMSGMLEFTPDENTPKEFYYQCYTHRYLGWKIHVVDGEVSNGMQVQAAVLTMGILAFVSYLLQ